MVNWISCEDTSRNMCMQFFPQVLKNWYWDFVLLLLTILVCCFTFRVILCDSLLYIWNNLVTVTVFHKKNSNQYGEDSKNHFSYIKFVGYNLKISQHCYLCNCYHKCFKNNFYVCLWSLRCLAPVDQIGCIVAVLFHILQNIHLNTDVIFYEVTTQNFRICIKRDSHQPSITKIY